MAATSGVARFSNLSIDKAGTGYTLTAAATGLTGYHQYGIQYSCGTCKSARVYGTAFVGDLRDSPFRQRFK